MLSTLCKDSSPEPEEIPHFQFLKKRARDFDKLSFQLSSPINKNMSMDSIPKEVVPGHISNGAVKPSTSNCRRRRNFSELHITLSEALEKLQAKGLLKPLDPKPIPYPVPRRYNLNSHWRYHQGKGHTTDGRYNLRHAIQDLIDQQVITLPSSASHPNFVWILFYKFFRFTLWFYCLFRICFLVGNLLNKVHVVFDAFDSSCYSYVNQK